MVLLQAARKRNLNVIIMFLNVFCSLCILEKLCECSQVGMLILSKNSSAQRCQLMWNSVSILETLISVPKHYQCKVF